MPVTIKKKLQLKQDTGADAAAEATPIMAAPVPAASRRRGGIGTVFDLVCMLTALLAVALLLMLQFIENETYRGMIILGS